MVDLDLEFDPEKADRWDFAPQGDGGDPAMVPDAQGYYVSAEAFDKLLALYSHIRSLTDEKINAQCEIAARAVLKPLLAEAAAEASKEG